MEDSMEVSENTKNRIIIWSSNSTSEHILEKAESQSSAKYLPSHVPSSIFHNIQNGHMCKQNRVYTHTRVSWSLKKERENSNMRYNMDDLQDFTLCEIKHS